jgi:magnesium transporter
VRSISEDVTSLIDHSGFLSNNVTFLLDAALGLISIEQNAILKIFSVASVILLPPTLVGAIYGMNFDQMPELKWIYGYPFALVIMLLSAILPYLYFRRRGWL